MKKLNVVKSVNGDKKRQGQGEKKVFLSLLLCVCAVFLISAMVVSNIEKAQPSAQINKEIKKEASAKEIYKAEEVPSVNISAEKTQEKPKDTPKVEIEAPKTEETASPKTNEIDIAQNEVFTIAKPVSGEILKIYSESKSVYSKTMGDWRQHNGIDINASIGESVFACADGVVEDVYDDPSMGMTVVINHGKLKSKYQNMASANIIQKGREVKKGEAIGIVGDTAEAEIADAAHLHFEILEGKLQQNPENLFE